MYVRMYVCTYVCMYESIMIRVCVFDIPHVVVIVSEMLRCNDCHRLDI